VTLTTNTTWIEYVREGRALCWLVGIERNGTTWTAVSGDREVSGFPPSVVAVEPASVAYDPGEDRRATTSRTTVLFARDGWIEGVIAADWLRGAKVKIKLGPRDLATGAWVTLPLLYVADLEIAEATIGLVCEEWTGLLSQSGEAPQGVNLHPLELIEAHFEASGLPSSIWSSSSLDPSDASNSAIAHLNCTLEDLARFPATYYYPANASSAPDDSDSSLSIAEDALAIVGGLFKHNESGQIEVGRSGGTGSAVRNWTTDDVRDVRQLESFSTLANRYIMRFVKLRDTGDAWASWQHESAAAQTALSIDGGTSPHLVTREMRLRCVNGSGQMGTTDSASGINGFVLTSSSTNFYVTGAGFTGWTGCRFGGSQIDADAVPSWARVSASKPAYVMLYGTGRRLETGGYDEVINRTDSARPEIIKVSDIKAYQVGGVFVPVRDRASGLRYPRDVRFTIAASGRAQFGTTTPAVGWRTGTPALDVTVPVLRASALLGRFDYGVPFIQCSTGLHEWPVELGDLVTLTHPTPVVHKSIGCDTSHIWEIVGKELYYGGQDSPRIQWTLAWYTDSVKPIHTATVPPGMGVRQVGVNYGDTIARRQLEAVSLVDGSGRRIVAGASQVSAPRSVLTPY
jgi:hypothetical protein